MDYQLKPIGKTCAATQKSLEAGATCYSVVIDKDGELVRLDFSEEGWTGIPEGTVGQWKCVVPTPTQTKTQPLDTDALMRYFEQIDEDGNPAQDKFRYVIALLLLQKRRLKLEGSRKDGEIEYLELIGTRGEGPFLLRDQQLEDEEVTQLQNSLNTHLASEWN